MPKNIISTSRTECKAPVGQSKYTTTSLSECGYLELVFKYDNTTTTKDAILIRSSLFGQSLISLKLLKYFETLFTFLN